MNGFSYKEVYIEEGRRVLEVNVLPEKYCNFDCIFCPIGRSNNKVDKQTAFEGHEAALEELGNRIDESGADLVFINSKGEAFVNEKLEEIIRFIQSKGASVRLLTNGYLLGRDEYRRIANICEEVLGEIKVITEDDFRKVQRPVDGYTIAEYVSNMVSFNRQYDGKFIFEVTIIKGYNDDEESVLKLKHIIDEISPDKVIVVRMDDDIFRKKLGISDERFEEITKTLADN